MRLLRGKVGGHFVIRNSDWFTCDRQLTVITGPEGIGKTTLLRALRSISPPAFDDDAAPFADYPKFFHRGGHLRKVMASKKTAVIAVFVCDEELRAALAKIDPVFYETDRIEVGRRLDATRWITFVEIASSSRWSELSDDMELLRKAVRERNSEAEFAEGFAFNDSLLPTDRIKGKIAERLQQLVVRVGERFTDDKELGTVLQRAAFIINRANRFHRAQQLVRIHLPVILHMEGKNLLQGEIDLDGSNPGRQQKSGTKLAYSGDLFLLGLLGLLPAQLQHKKPDARASEESRHHLHLRELCARIAGLVRQWLPSCDLSIEAEQGERCIALRASQGDGCFLSLEALPAYLRWLISCAAAVLYYSGIARREILFLLDEPDALCIGDEVEKLFRGLHGLSATCQCVLVSARLTAGSEGGRVYVLEMENEEEGSTLRSVSS